MIKKCFRVYYAYKLSNHHQQFWIRAQVIDNKKINDKAWEMIHQAHPGVKLEVFTFGSIQEIDEFY